MRKTVVGEEQARLVGELECGKASASRDSVKVPLVQAFLYLKEAEDWKNLGNVISYHLTSGYIR